MELWHHDQPADSGVVPSALAFWPEGSRPPVGPQSALPGLENPPRVGDLGPVREPFLEQCSNFRRAARTSLATVVSSECSALRKQELSSRSREKRAARPGASAGSRSAAEGRRGARAGPPEGREERPQGRGARRWCFLFRRQEEPRAVGAAAAAGAGASAAGVRESGCARFLSSPCPRAHRCASALLRARICRVRLLRR